MGAPDKWFMNPQIQEAFPSGATASRVRPSQPDTSQQGTLGRDPSRYTGVGADGVYQPKAVAGQLHEGEWALSAPVTQAIGADTLQALKTAAESGALTSDKLNMIRQAVGLQGQRGFQAGTDMDAYAAARGSTGGVTQIGGGTLDKRAAMAASNAGTGAQYGTGIAQRPGDLQRGVYGAGRTGDTTLPGKLEAIARSNAGTGAQYGSGIAQQPQPLLPQPFLPTNQQYSFTPDLAAGKRAAMAASNAGTGTQYGTGIAKTPASVTGVGPSGADRSTLYRTLGMQGLADMARGQSPYFQAIQDIQQRRLAGQGAAAEEAMRQEMAQGGVGGGVARAALGEQSRDIGSQMAEARAKTSAEQMRLAQEATGALATQGLAGMEFDYKQNVDALAAAGEAGDLGAVADLYERTYNRPLDISTLQGTQNATRFTRGITTANSLLLTNPDTAWDSPSAALALGDMWTATHPGQAASGDAYNTWAQDQWATLKVGADPLFRAARSVTQDGANALFGADFVNNYSRTDAQGNVTTGWPAFNTDLGMMSASGGLSVDPVTGNVDFDMSNPLVYKIFGGDTAPDFTNISTFKNAPTVVGTRRDWGGKTYTRTGTNPTDWALAETPTDVVTIGDTTETITPNAMWGNVSSTTGMPVYLNPATDKYEPLTYGTFKTQNDSSFDKMGMDKVVYFANKGDAGAMSDLTAHFGTPNANSTLNQIFTEQDDDSLNLHGAYVNKASDDFLNSVIAGNYWGKNRLSGDEQTKIISLATAEMARRNGIKSSLSTAGLNSNTINTVYNTLFPPVA